MCKSIKVTGCKVNIQNSIAKKKKNNSIALTKNWKLILMNDNVYVLS